MANQRGFASDNYAGVHPAVMARMAEVNQGHQSAYGDDTETARFQEIVKELFGKNAVGFPVFNGTGANVIALQSAVKRWEAVICVESAHIHMDEGGAPEKWLDKILPNVDVEGSSLEREKDKTLVR